MGLAMRLGAGFGLRLAFCRLDGCHWDHARCPHRVASPCLAPGAPFEPQSLSDRPCAVRRAHRAPAQTSLEHSGCVTPSKRGTSPKHAFARAQCDSCNVIRTDCIAFLGGS